MFGGFFSIIARGGAAENLILIGCKHGLKQVNEITF